MSAILGIYQMNGRPVDQENLEHMLQALAHRGPDGRGLWREGQIGLGHQMFWTTPESLHEQLPLVDNRTHLSITADARVDNREELIDTLRLADAARDSLSDSALILAAYEHWGERCVEHLLGDFSFAIWDGNKRQLFCARDHFGVKPFYYYCGQGMFLFATELKGILTANQSLGKLNDEYIVRYLLLQLDETQQTFYQDIFRLPPAHLLIMNSNGMSLQHYWKPNPRNKIRLSSDEEYVEAFRDYFFKAVQCRLRSAFPLGSTLSGGMDSSSVSCTARDLLLQENTGRQLHTYSAIFEKLPQCDERAYIQTAIDAGGIDPHLIPVDGIGPLRAYREGQNAAETPYVGTTYYLHLGLYDAMQQQGVRIALDGHGGDDTICHGIAYLTELAGGFRWRSFYREAYAFSRLHGISLKKLAWQFGVQPFVEGFQQRRKIHDAQRMIDALPISKALRKQHAHLISELVNKEAKARTPRTVRAAHFQAITRKIDSFTFESMDKLAMDHLIEPRYPFYDRRLVEFCYALPADQKLHNGWTRMILHRAMAGILPEKIQWRAGKSNLGPHFEQRLLDEDRRLIIEVMKIADLSIDRYIDKDALQKHYQALVTDVAGVRQHWTAVWPAITLMVWFTQKHFQHYLKNEPTASFPYLLSTERR